ncbi:MAG: flagellar motor protein [Hydrogenophilales bacterium CG03_land_8_20_14_0_80_62_28]|nr:flagellar motor protein [Betaproteobacteria bacterium]OIO79086.1 MAG: flagellar motor protein [Hydrogenophilaceae bacterium CG1_02_62_390]PIV24408.1 MAG: flagellar motor protein [Hydrogenophilales bacterium CG03_land_8_20_14_0_80_62_28]PIW39656.1 MAG: flagellar motor protein [Hydrogenophilales bacterium CG15_BIG_FIL_POST_REV_8_21_14_020_62_31]PIW71985.1 MAG: flagellar motor protein [Hydrogenophilales bacterium CG12_big_fil_rev_8_21_14_0_65_61_21]PIY99187.1 MAG: flagellar motor protein [Hydr
MDIISIAGLFLGLAAIVVGQALEGGQIGSLLQFTAFLIVIGGTMGAVMLQSSLRVFLDGINMAKWVFRPPPYLPQDTLNLILSWSHLARRGGLLALEPMIDQQNDLFERRGLQMLVDGAEPEVLRDTLEMELSSHEAHRLEAAKIWQAAGGYSPTIGILGAVLGLIHVMENLTDPSKLGAGIAVAFVATIYGVGGANLIFLPIAGKLRYHVNRSVRMKEMFIEGIVAIANGENPRMIEAKLQGYLV